MNGYPRFIPLAVAAGLFSACAPSRLAVKPDFWQDRNARIGVALMPHPEGGAHRSGAQGLLDMAINDAATADLRAHLGKFEPVAFDDLRDAFVEEMAKRGMAVKPIAQRVDPKNYPAWAGESSDQVFKTDLSGLARKEGVDVLVLLNVKRFGTIRSYWGFIPLGAPMAFCEVQGQMIDLKTNRLLWRGLNDEKKASVPVADPWDQRPDFPNLTAALRKALENGKAFLKEEMFAGQPPSPGLAAAPPAPNPGSAAPVPAATNGATSTTPAIDDVTRLPRSSPRMVERYRAFLTRPLPRAFAISESGEWWMAWGKKPPNPNQSTDPSERALRGCEGLTKSRCFLYAVDDRVVYKPSGP